MKKHIAISTSLIVFCAAAGAVLLANLSQGLIHSSVWIILLPCAIFVAFAEWFFLQNHDRRLQCIFALLGFFIVLAASVSLRLHAAHQTGISALIKCLLTAFCWGPAIGQFCIWLKKGLQLLNKPLRLNGKHAFWLSFAVILVCWLPALLALFPGVTGYDLYAQVAQNITRQYNVHHPLAHTLLIGLFYHFGDMIFSNASLGIGIYTTLQMLGLGAAMAYAMYWLCMKHCSAILWTVLLAFFALAPQHAIMACSLTKDIPFATALFVLVIELCRWHQEPERSKLISTRIRIVLLIALIGILRRNLVYALVLMFLIFFIPYWRCLINRRMASLFLAGFLILSGTEAGLKTAVKAEDTATIRETMALPCQQLARVYHLYGLSHPVGYEIREILPYAENYAPERADQAKRAAKITTPDRLIRFIKLWLRESIHYPVEYLDAFLYTTRAYWDPTDFAYAYTYDMEADGPRGCLTTNHNSYTGVERFDILPGLRAVYHRLFTDNAALQYPLLRLLIHPAWSVWMLLFAAAWAIHEHRQDLLLPILLNACYLFTLLLGPCAIVRYSYYLMLSAPVLTAALCCQNPSALSASNQTI